MNTIKETKIQLDKACANAQLQTINNLVQARTAIVDLEEVGAFTLPEELKIAISEAINRLSNSSCLEGREAMKEHLEQCAQGVKTYGQDQYE